MIPTASFTVQPALFPVGDDELSHLRRTYDEAMTLFTQGNVIDAGLKFKALLESLDTVSDTDESVLSLKQSLDETIAGLKQRFMLSKTSYLKGCQCRKLLYLYKHSPSLRDPISQETQAKFNGGHSFEDVFRDAYYPQGTSVETILQGHVQFYPYLTELLLKQNVNTLFEAGFVHNETIAMVDVLNKYDGENWELVEIKNSPFLKEVFIHDAALQYHIVSNKLQNLNRVQIVLNQKGKPVYFDVTEEAMCRQHLIEQRIERFRELLSQDAVPDIETGAQCFKPYRCDFFGYCHGVPSSY